MRAHITLSPKQFSVAVLSVGITGALGTLLRDLALRLETTHWYVVLVGATPVDGAVSWSSQIPWILMTINVVGVYLAARLLVGRLRAHDPNNLSRLMVITGFLGGLTSYSSLFVSLSTIWDASKLGAVAVGLLALASGVGAGWLGARRRRHR